MNEKRYPFGALIELGERLLTRAGLRPADALAVAELLVEADLMGHTTHGLQLLPAYLDELANGRMKAQGEPEVLKDAGSAVLWDGGYLNGVWLTRRAVAEALLRAEHHPSVTYVIRRAHHIGCLAAYMPLIIEHGFLGILAASDPAAAMVAPFGSRQAVYSPNPIAAGIPAGPGGPIIIDISSSMTAGGVVNRHRRAGTPLPGRWLLDGEGNPTADPAALSGSPPGSILPLGGEDLGYKGYALGLLIEALTSGLAGFGRADSPTNWGTSVYLQIINPAAFGGRAAFEREAGWLARACREAAPRPGAERARVPGDRALELREQQKRHGVAIAAELMEDLRERDRAGKE